MDAESQTFGFVLKKANDSLYDLSSELRKVQKLSNRGNDAVLARAMASMASQIGETTKLASAVSGFSDVSASEKKQQRELQFEFDDLLHRVNSVQQSVSEQLRKKQRDLQRNQQLNHQQNHQQTAQNANESTPLLDPSSGSGAGQQLMQQQVLDQLDSAEVDLNTSLIDSRDAEIAEVQRGAREINAIFQDLGVLVTEQGQQLDTVEDNISNLARQTENAGRQLIKAESYQRSRGKWTCIALLVLLAITVLVALSVIS